MTQATSTHAGVRQAQKVRLAYLEASLRQDVPYHDLHGTAGGVVTSLNEDVAAVQAAISQRVASLVQHSATFLGGVAIALYRGWELALLLVALTPIMGLAFMIAMSMAAKGARALGAAPAGRRGQC